MFIPKKSKFKKQQKGIKPNSINGLNCVNQLTFGSIGLKAISFCRLNSKQIETIKKIISKGAKAAKRLVSCEFLRIRKSRSFLLVALWTVALAVDESTYLLLGPETAVQTAYVWAFSKEEVRLVARVAFRFKKVLVWLVTVLLGATSSQGFSTVGIRLGAVGTGCSASSNPQSV